jgi:ABC-type branched-subunit amino acid transport system substrate-binding protein
VVLVPRLRISWDTAQHASDGEALRLRLLDGEPRIMLDDMATTVNSVEIAPHLLDDPKSAPWVHRFVARWKMQPNDYCITSYGCVLVIADAITRIQKSGKPMTRPVMRDAIEATKIDTLQGTITFDKNGDLASRIISVFQIKHNSAYPANDMAHQFKCIGVAPQDGTA